MIQVTNISKQFGPQLLLDDVSFTVDKGDRIALIGKNGSGKTTLFKMITGEITSDTGEIVAPKNYRIGALAQHISFSKVTIMDECAEVLKGEREYDTYLIGKILTGLGFSESDLQRNPREFSGGFQIRIMLAKILLESPDMLLLDEPTNYLDIVSIRWLIGFLKGYPGELIIISHDRSFLDAVCTHTLGLKRKKAKKVKGPTEKYFTQIEQEEQTYEQTRLNQEKRKKDLEQFVERFKAKASKATQAQSRVKLLGKMEMLSELEQERMINLEFQYAECPSKNLGNIGNISFGYSEQKEIIANFSLDIRQGDRIAIIGKNGKGKSTLLNLMAKELSPNQGTIKYHDSCEIGHFGQTNINRLSGDLTVVDEISSANASLPISKIRAICGALMFEGEMALKKVKVLSGGERSRVLLGKIMASPNNLLLLDEPTNHLDIESINILMNELACFDGTVVIVTHSEDILRTIPNKLIIFQSHGIETFNGTYDEFLEKIGWEEESSQSRDQIKGEDKLSRKDVKRLRSEIINERSKILSPLKIKISDSENKICKLEESVSQVMNELEKATNLNNGAKIGDLSKQLAMLQKEIDQEFVVLEETTTLHDEHAKLYEVKLQELES